MIIFAVIFLLLSIHQQVTSSKTQPQHLHTGQKPSRIFSFSKAIVIQLAYQKKMIVCLCLLETVVSWYQALRVVPSYILSRSQPFRYAFYNMYQRMFGGLRVGRLLCWFSIRRGTSSNKTRILQETNITLIYTPRKQLIAKTLQIYAKEPI